MPLKGAKRMKSYLKLNNEVLNHYSRTGKLDLAKDREATRRYFLEHVNVKMRYFIDLEEKIRYLVEEGYYEAEFLKQYDMAFIKRMYEKAYAYKFRFPSFMSASKFYESYAMKSRDGEEILEKYEDRIVITALYLARGDEQLAERAVDAMMTAYQPATPTALNSGKKSAWRSGELFQADHGRFHEQHCRKYRVLPGVVPAGGRCRRQLDRPQATR